MHIHTLGNVLPDNQHQIKTWLQHLKQHADSNPMPLVPPIEALSELVKQDKELLLLSEQMFNTSQQTQSPQLSSLVIQSFDEFLVLLNAVMTQAPVYIRSNDMVTDALNPAGFVGLPINALLAASITSSASHSFFSNLLVTQQFKKILNYWSVYLASEASRDMLVKDDLNQTPQVLAWLNPMVQKQIIGIACEASFDPALREYPFEHFFECDPNDDYYGFRSWDDFFTRKFTPSIRPIATDDDVIVNPCESAPLQVVENVELDAKFWLKGHPYSLQNMMNFNPLAEQFIGGTVYQAYLNALSYHRWHSPVSGTIKKVCIVNGSYDYTPNTSLPLLTAIATRAIIFIESDNPYIGLMCFIAVGIAEVSSCEITVAQGQHVDKGDQLGMFHCGGSTHCLIFRPQVNLSFDFHRTEPGLDATNIPVCSCIAVVN
ncbi:phophatidylserine decarboxylase associated domain-containing protein [Photobacterium phosphoreum]|uniref:phophatidylserine decarboxylase associated domain-containing protein n=1 Tax=Photobacterium phosphoreum TaxID=659 RepID=UPI0039B10DF2